MKERLLEHLEEEESEQKRAKTSESGGASKAGASSSRPETSEEEVPSSRGGVPMAADAGDSVPEIAKRKIGDSELGESEDPKDNKYQDRNGGSIEEWEEFAKTMKIRAEERVEESKNPGACVDICHFDVAREIEEVCVCVCESDSKFNEETSEFVWRDYDN